MRRHAAALAEHLFAVLRCPHGALPLSIADLAHETQALKVIRSANNHLLHAEVE
jgi:hypothetical protein